MRRAFDHVPQVPNVSAGFIIFLSLIAFAPWSWFFWLIVGPILYFQLHAKKDDDD